MDAKAVAIILFVSYYLHPIYSWLASRLGCKKLLRLSSWISSESLSISKILIYELISRKTGPTLEISIIIISRSNKFAFIQCVLVIWQRISVRYPSMLLLFLLGEFVFLFQLFSCAVCFTFAGLFNMHTRTQISAYVHFHTYTHWYMHTRTHACARTFLHARTHANASDL